MDTATEPKKRGRKPRHPDFLRKTEIKVRYSSNEIVRITRAAEQIGAVRADFIRQAVIYCCTRPHTLAAVCKFMRSRPSSIRDSGPEPG